MSAGLFALFDDVAVLAKLAAASTDDVAAATGRATAKAAGVVVDDTAVTPQYLEGVDPSRELPIIGKITLGSLRNKAIIIVAALLLSEFVPWILTPILMCGGLYLCYEGAVKLRGHEEDVTETARVRGPDAEKALVRSAVTTDFILSTEIMMIALDEVASEGLVSRAVILVITGIAITALVYGVVALIVKMDDVGLLLARRDSAGAKRTGNALVKAMPVLLSVISFVGMLAMLWVGGHILLDGMHELGCTAPLDLIHHLAEPIHHLAGVGGVLAWIVETGCSLLFGLLVGAVVLAVLHALPFGPHAHTEEPRP